MADEANPNPPLVETPPPAETPPAATPPAGQPSGERTFTQAEVNRIVADRLARANQRPAAEPSRSASTPPRTDTSATPPPVLDVRAEVARIRSFERAASPFGLSAEALTILESDFNAADPPDPVAWVTQRATAFGWRTQQQSHPTNPPPASGSNGTPAAQPPQPTPGSAPPSRVVTEDTRIVDMSIADRVALASRIGNQAFRVRLRQEQSADTRRFSLRR